MKQGGVIWLLMLKSNLRDIDGHIDICGPLASGTLLLQDRHRKRRGYWSGVDRDDHTLIVQLAEPVGVRIHNYLSCS